MPKDKERLDILLVDRGLVETRARARAHIMAGEVTVNGQRIDKAGTAVARDALIELATPLPYVSRGGYKLAGALDGFGVAVAGRVCADVGACTGGFTDVLLQRGAARVYAIDVGQGQLDWKLRQDERVTVMERTNARYLDALAEPIDLVVIDVSFISLKLILPAVRKWLAATGEVIALIKPQFEAGPESVGKGGIVRDPAVHRAVLVDLLGWAAAAGWAVGGLRRSSIAGTDGNVEFLVWLRPGESLLDHADLIATSLS
ncbi:putative rRNA methyltransferase YqxC [Candidatus Promineifilum breve]|uniref:rRNA methyltransferase YqxC n=2 Tax=Candidatus Promineifilum breve TaxID=1806508 RepID=A0A160SYB8_9CHLR|nr:TlyA family RNA methyltransferase [Candidatus Promineifilum breve]CUS02034.2 putative rRNA methyltransferase YqxC [Candidatus Promineifilum breve]